MRGIVKSALLCAAFVAGLALILLALSPIAVPKGNAARDGMHYVPASGIEAEPAGTIDALFLGDSECYYDFIPLLFWQQRGYATYVCATPNQKLCDTLDWLKRVCARQEIRLVVLEADNLFIPVTPGDGLMAALKRAFPLLDYHDRWKELRARDFTGEAPEYTHRVMGRGFVFDDNRLPAEKDADDYMRDTGEKQEITALCKGYVRRIDAFCRERGIRLMLVSTPRLTGWGAAYHAAVEALAQEMGLEYIDLNERTGEIGIDWSEDTFDAGYHMNYTGAVKVSSYFLEYLDATGLLPDHRGDKRYRAWNRDVKKARRKGMAL